MNDFGDGLLLLVNSKPSKTVSEKGILKIQIRAADALIKIKLCRL